jgi:hypothetical protein
MHGHNRGITIIDVMRELQVEPTPRLSWEVGAAVRDYYEQFYGCLPEKELRPKTNAGGTHCFAVYPESMKPKIIKIIKLHEWESQRQMELF